MNRAAAFYQAFCRAELEKQRDDLTKQIASLLAQLQAIDRQLGNQDEQTDA